MKKQRSMSKLKIIIFSFSSYKGIVGYLVQLYEIIEGSRSVVSRVAIK